MKTRIISGAVGIAILIAVMFTRGTLVFNAAFGLVAVLITYELCKAKKLDKEHAYLGLSAAFALLTPIGAHFAGDIAALAGLYIMAAFAYIVMVTAVLLFRHKTVKSGGFYTCTAYNLLICGCIISVCRLETYALIFAFMGAWVADTGAYFAGTFLGKHKLCPEISPKKTVEGLIGGILANAAAFTGYAAWLNRGAVGDRLNLFTCAAVGAVCCLLGLLGDLTASLIKRECGIKDYGNIMPGHGGAMDRFDSLIYIAPFMLMMVTAGSEIMWIG